MTPARKRRYIPPAATRRLIARLALQVAEKVAGGGSVERALAEADAALAVGR